MNVAELFLIAMAIVFTISRLIWLAVVAPRAPGVSPRLTFVADRESRTYLL